MDVFNFNEINPFEAIKTKEKDDKKQKYSSSLEYINIM